MVPEALSAHASIDLAVAAEAAGLDAVWFTEIDKDPFTRCAAAIMRTQRIQVATGVAQWTRSPPATALTALELHELSDGRFTLGLGTGTAYQNRVLHNIEFVQPAVRMREYIAVIRGVWRAIEEPFNFVGDHFTVTDFVQPHPRATAPPLLLAAVGSAMLRLAARRADGVLLNPSTTPLHVRARVEPQLDAAAGNAMSSLSTFRRATCVRVSVDSDPGVARERARRDIAHYGSYPVHQDQYRLYGFGHEVDLIVRALGADDMEAAVGAVTDDMVDVLALAGTAVQVRRGLRTWAGAVDAVALVPATSGLDRDEVEASCAAVLAAVAPSS